jgi:hypothetical protein
MQESGDGRQAHTTMMYIYGYLAPFHSIVRYLLVACAGYYKISVMTKASSHFITSIRVETLIRCYLVRYFNLPQRTGNGNYLCT